MKVAYTIILGGKKGYFTTVDLEDSDWLLKSSWHPKEHPHTVYVMGRPYNGRRLVNGRLAKVFMHRAIMEYHYGSLGNREIDHIDRNGLNNCKSNLRITDRSGNAKNTCGSCNRRASKYKGVSFHEGRYYARIACGGKTYNLGSYDFERDAAIVYNIKAKELFGEFAFLNNIDISNEDEARLVIKKVGRNRRSDATTKYRGVSRWYHGNNGKPWKAIIYVDRHPLYLGSFPTQEEAALAWNVAAIKQWGDQARLNVLIP